MKLQTRVAVACSLLFFASSGLCSDGSGSEKSQSCSASQRVSSIAENGFDSTGFLILGLGLSAVVLAQTQDYAIRATWSDYQRMSSETARVGDFIGKGFPGIGVALLQLYFDPENGRSHAEALVATFLTTTLLKEANHRGRPDSENRQSMPSGHTSTTFASATSLLYSYGWRIGAPAYLIGSFTAASRWSDDAHWFSDTVAGAVVGIFWGRATRGHDLGFEPIVSSNAIGARWVHSF